MAEQEPSEQDSGWVSDDSLDGQLAQALGAWIGRAISCNTQVFPAPPGSTEPMILLTLRIQPRNEGDPLIEQKCLLSPEGARALSDGLRAAIRDAR